MIEHSLRLLRQKRAHLNKMNQSNLDDHATHDSANVDIINAPLGPETSDNHVYFQGRPLGEEDTNFLRRLVYPNDTYTLEDVYWADLPYRKQLAFNTNVDIAEIKKELSSIWLMTKKNPLSPIGWYFKNAVLPGAGLGLEGSARIWR
jgi:hypothetical protein